LRFWSLSSSDRMRSSKLGGSGVGAWLALARASWPSRPLDHLLLRGAALVPGGLGRAASGGSAGASPAFRAWRASPAFPLPPPEARQSSASACPGPWFDNLLVSFFLRSSSCRVRSFFSFRRRCLLQALLVKFHLTLADDGLDVVLHGGQDALEDRLAVLADDKVPRRSSLWVGLQERPCLPSSPSAG